jgi:hypothetical protein
MAQPGRPKKAQPTESPVRKPVLTKDQADQLRQILENTSQIRRTLGQLEDSDDLSLPKVMFAVGKAFKMADEAEDAISDLLGRLDESSYSLNF